MRIRTAKTEDAASDKGAQTWQVLLVSLVAASVIVGGTIAVHAVWAPKTVNTADHGSAVGGYDPEALVTTAQDELGQNVDLGSARLVAKDADFNAVPVVDSAADAATLTATFAPTARHTWVVFTGPADTDDPSATTCPSYSGVISCKVVQYTDSSVVTSVVVARLLPEAGEGMYTFADPSSLTQADLKDLRVSLNVREFRSDGTQVSATENVFQPSTLAFDSLFSSSVQDLTSLVTDQSLIAP